MAGVYIHIPFCRTFCTYCGFYSVCDEKRIGPWLGSLFREMEARRDFFSACGGVPPSTLYIGGGTPSRLEARDIGDIARSAMDTFRRGDPFDEFTVEVNPDDVTPGYAAGLHRAGVSRVSMGVQSFDDRALKWMNRRHTREGALRAFEALREAGFGNISIDMIFGYLLPGESEKEGMARWKRDLETAVSLTPEHISAYQMSIEPESLLGERVLRGEYSEPEDSYCASQYELLQFSLAGAGYEQYEVSNFARTEADGTSPYRSRHNSSYWTREPYIGIGPAAHSFSGRTRSWNPSDVEGYISAGGTPQTESEILTDEEILEEKVMLGLRRAEGISLSEVPFMTPAVLSGFVSAGMLVCEGDRVRIPACRWFVSDDIITEILTQDGR